MAKRNSENDGKAQKNGRILRNLLTEIRKESTIFPEYNTKRGGKQRRLLNETPYSLQIQLFPACHDGILNDGNEGFRFQTGSSDQGAIDISL